jgi:hypothetical protein
LLEFINVEERDFRVKKREKLTRECRLTRAIRAGNDDGFRSGHLFPEDRTTTSGASQLCRSEDAPAGFPIKFARNTFSERLRHLPA